MNKVAGTGMSAVLGESRMGVGGRSFVCLLLLLGMFFSLPAEGAELKPEAKAAFQKYIDGLEARLEARNHSQDGFLWIDEDPERLKLVKSGQIATAQVKAFSVAGSMVQHWIGGVFLP